MPKRLNIIFCAPKCAPNSGKRLCWHENLAHIVQHWEVALFKDYIVSLKVLNKDSEAAPINFATPTSHRKTGHLHINEGSYNKTILKQAF